MRIEKVKIDNYRSIVNCEFNFIDFYTAISGKNNAGKSNILKAIVSFFNSNNDTSILSKSSNLEIDIENDYPLWKEENDSIKSIKIEISIVISKSLDAGLFRFITTFLAITTEEESICLCLGKAYTEETIKESLIINLDNKQSKIIEDYFQVQEVHKRIRSSKVMFFHNSTQRRDRIFSRDVFNSFGEISTLHKSKLKNAQDSIFKTLKAIAQKHKEDIVELLGRLDDKYEVDIAVPRLNIENFPFSISLGDKKYGTPLENWGSGTQNRTRILLALLQTKKKRESASESDKITPIIIIEEPESFLHPSAQAEFGKVLQDIAQEFQIQVIATTHSPHMLSMEKPGCNLLLSRKQHRNQLRETELVDTIGENWMEPFALALGTNNDAFLKWKNILFKNSEELLLVEGDIDKEYFEDLIDKKHGNNALDFKGEIFAYGGSGFFDNSVLLKFILSRFPIVYITYDFDIDSKVSKTLQYLGLKKIEDFIAIGIDQDGRRDIEGLLPSEVNSAVYSKYSDLINKALDKDKNARQMIKRAKLEEFKKAATIENGYYAEFYKITQIINKALKKKRKPQTHL